MVGRRRKMSKLHLKRPKMVPKNETWNQKIKDYKPHICTFNFRFSSRNSQSQQKQKRSLILQLCFAQKKSLILRASANSIIKRYTPATKPKTHSLIQSFQETCFRLVSEKIFILHDFQTPKNGILEALGQQISVYSCISPQENVCSREVRNLYLVCMCM